MKTVFEHIEQVKGRPHHIRKRVAFSAAGGVTAFIALVWLSVSLGTGVFAIQGSSFADARSQSSVAVSDTGSSANSGLAGVAAALPGTDTNAPARIQIIDTSSSTTAGPKAEQTTLPF